MAICLSSIRKPSSSGPSPSATTDLKQQGVWSTYGLDGAPGRSFFYYTNNGVTNPTLHMRPGEVQRWRLLNASEGDNLLIALEGHGLNIVAMDGITVPNMYKLKPGNPVVMGPGQRMDVLVKAGDARHVQTRRRSIPALTMRTVVPHTDGIRLTLGNRPGGENIPPQL